MQTNVKLSPGSLTSPAHPPISSNPTLTILSLFEFREKFVPLPTMEKTNFVGSHYLLHVPFYCFTNISIIMGKVTSLYGKTMGKIGSIVFSTSGGQTIAREYNPHVANPNTIAQVNQRARMKLMSQLSASLSPVIAMTKDGLVSKRNKFVKLNFGNSYASGGVAQVSYENLQLTEGSTGFPQIVVDAYEEAVVDSYVKLASAPAANITRVIYCVFVKSEENKLQYLNSVIATERYPQDVPGAIFGAILPNMEVQTIGSDVTFTKEYVIFAYGMADTSERATARYSNLNVQSASDIATLVANRTISFEDYQFTQTRGTTIGQGTSGDAPTPAGKARVYVTALGEGGTVSGGGTFDIGSEVTVTATPAGQYAFRAWVKNGTSQVVSTSATYTFTLNGQTDLIAQFDFVGNDTL